MNPHNSAGQLSLPACHALLECSAKRAHRFGCPRSGNRKGRDRVLYLGDFALKLGDAFV
jgi:hypothetical protein